MRRYWLLATLGSGVLMLGSVVAAQNSLGVFSGWGAFENKASGRCYAIAKAQPDPRQRERQPYMTVTSVPHQRIAGQIYWRLSRTPSKSAPVGVQIGPTYFRIAARGPDAWAQDATQDAAMNAALRGAEQLSVIYRDNKGRRFSDRYRLTGAATAIDAAALACANLR